MLLLSPDAYKCFLVRIAPGQVDQSISYLEDMWTRMAPQWPFEYSFLDQELNALYRDEQRLGQLFGYFAILAIVIACLGLFGLAAFMAQQRTKEIGVRKVLGASVSSVVALLSKDFVRLVLIAFVIAAPIGYVVMNRWLEDFAYRVHLSMWTFLLAGLASMGIALLTISFHSIKAALSDPVKNLRYE